MTGQSADLHVTVISQSAISWPLLGRRRRVVPPAADTLIDSRSDCHRRAQLRSTLWLNKLDNNPAVAAARHRQSRKLGYAVFMAGKNHIYDVIEL